LLYHFQRQEYHQLQQAVGMKYYTMSIVAARESNGILEIE